MNAMLIYTSFFSAVSIDKIYIEPNVFIRLK